MPDVSASPPPMFPVGRLGRSLRPLVGGLLAALIGLGAVASPAAGATTWTRNLWVAEAFLYQDPYSNACTAAATMFMLNTIAYRGTGGPGFAWTPYRIKDNEDPSDKRDMTSILAFARKHDTLDAEGRGSDPHGWRNALNFHGWGDAAMRDPSLMPYVDRAYASFDGAVKAAVKAIARRRMPVGLLAWAGRHAYVMTGYAVTGADPSVSSQFTVQAVYLSDPLRADDLVNRKVTIDALRSGASTVRYKPYREADSPFDDPYVPEVIPGSIPPSEGPSEWYGRWVVVLPLRPGLPPAAQGS